ncbi:MAG: NAD-dependent epimerase/dehydratase family protein [Rhodobacteraceae bacterium]|nr:NAD-dependent epimerase/dehydratase family protein [Paracoccaceae bacterium]
MNSHILVVGGTGRLGRLLCEAWEFQGARQPLWQARRQVPFAGSVFDPLAEPGAYRDAAKGAVAILNLAGRASSGTAAPGEHSTLALAALEAGRAASVRHVFLASSAAVYGACEDPMDEASLLRPLSAYGREKRKMEEDARGWANRAGRDAPGVTCLRIGNVAGADQILGGDGKAVPALDFFADGRSPRRSYIGPLALASVLGQLFQCVEDGRNLPFHLNVALEGTVAMDALLAADGRRWHEVPAGPGAIPEVRLDVARLKALVDLPAGGTDAAAIVTDLRTLRPRDGSA